MKKKIYFLLSVAVVILVATTYSCKETDAGMNSGLTTRLTLDYAHESFNEIISKADLHHCDELHYLFDPGEFEAKWDKAVFSSNEVAELLTMPIGSSVRHESRFSNFTFEGSMISSGNIYQKLLMSLRYDQDITDVQSYIISVIPTPEFDQKHPEIGEKYVYGLKNEGFEGFVIMKRLDGVFISAGRYYDGELIEFVYDTDLPKEDKNGLEEQVQKLLAGVTFVVYNTSSIYTRQEYGQVHEADPAYVIYRCPRCHQLKANCTCPAKCIMCGKSPCICSSLPPTPPPPPPPLPGGEYNPAAGRQPYPSEIIIITRVINKLKSFCLTSWMTTQNNTVQFQVNNTLNVYARFYSTPNQIVLKQMYTDAAMNEFVSHEMMHAYQKATLSNFDNLTAKTGSGSRLVNLEFECDIMSTFFVNVDRVNSGLQPTFMGFCTPATENEQWARNIMADMVSMTNNFTRNLTDQHIQTLFSSHLGNYRTKIHPDLPLNSYDPISLHNMIANSPGC